MGINERKEEGKVASVVVTKGDVVPPGRERKGPGRHGGTLMWFE